MEQEEDIVSQSTTCEHKGDVDHDNLTDKGNLEVLGDFDDLEFGEVAFEEESFDVYLEE